MKILDKIELLKNKEEDFLTPNSVEYEKALQKYSKMVEKGITKRRGYCLSSIADYTNITFQIKKN